MAYTPLKVGTPVTWVYRSAHGFGYVEKVLVKGSTAATTKYQIRQVDNHVGPNGAREKKLVVHWATDVREISASTVQAQAKKAKADPDKG